MQHSSVVDRGRRSSAAAHRKSPGFSRAWCCSFAAAPGSPDPRSAPSPKPHSKPLSTGSPSPSAKRIIDPRRILSPGRVSPLPQTPSPPPLDPVPDNRSPPPSRPEPPSPVARVSTTERGLDLRLSLKGKDGKVLVLELDSRVLCESSSFFAAMVLEARRKVSDMSTDCRKIEVGGVEDLGVFKETIELMYEKDAMRWLMNAGVSRVIGILEVSSTVMFDRGVISCLKYLEAVPWSESEEEKLKILFTKCVFDEEVSKDVLARLGEQGQGKSEELAVRLIQSVASGMNCNARKELQSLVNGLLSKSSVYQKDPAGLNKESLYNVCYSCLNSLIELFEEASGSIPSGPKSKETKPLVERVSKEVENLNWLLEILIEKQMAEDFVCLWANQAQLIMLHQRASPMIRYELSRVSASVFIALGKGKVQCKGDTRMSVLLAWFTPMLMDFGWLQRCSKGLDMRMLEEGLGQALLTLPLKQQQTLFVEWFQCFSLKGTECPNLGKAFQVWWRRSFVKSSELRS
ncbi:putative BTB/POZ domain-containing protein [Dioscorea sansibarensis]